MSNYRSAIDTLDDLHAVRRIIIMSNYRSAIDRLNRCQSLGDIGRALKGFERVHQVGHLTDGELQRLDSKAFGIILDWQEATQ